MTSTALDRTFTRLGASVRSHREVHATAWNPPELTDLIGRIDTALRERRAR